MENSKRELKTKILRRVIQGFFLAFTVFFLVKFVPNRSFMLITLALIIFITVVFRTGFCGWICPLGTIFDFVRGLGKGIGRLPFVKPINKKYKKWVKNNRGILDKIDKYARYFKYVFFLWILQAAFLDLATIKNGDEHGLITVLYFVIAVLVVGLFVDRSWCKYACPLGAAIGLFGKLSPTRVSRDEDLCISCSICSRACPMNIDVANKKYVKDLDCNTCVKCVDVCPVDGALDLRIKLPLSKKQNSQIVETAEKQAVK